MLRNPLLIIALLLTVSVASWGIYDTAGLATFAKGRVDIIFQSRGWFVMLTASVLLITSLWLAFSRYGNLRLGGDDDQPEFSTFSWLTMMFAAGMGVGLLFYGSAEPISHFLFMDEYVPQELSLIHISEPTRPTT